jgi:hypothetical protein
MIKFVNSMISIILLLVLCTFDVLPQNNMASHLKSRTVPFNHYHFSDYDKDAQSWNGLYIASNNKIYIGLCTHADAATVYEFDIATRKMRQLANLTKLLDERGRAIWTNGKIHVKMQELDGYVYFGSFCEDNGPPAFDARTYKGPYWFRIRMSDGHVETLSKINSFWGLLGQDMDKQRRIVYGLNEDGQFCRYFIDEDYTEHLGRVDNWDICRTIFMDNLGNVYGSYPPGRIWKFDVEKDRIFDLEYLKLPISIDSRTMANPMLDRRAQWRIIEWDTLQKVAYGIIGGNNLLFRYDVHKGVEGEITPLTTLCPPEHRNKRPFDIPHATLAFTISQKERKAYYIPVTAGDFDYGEIVTTGERAIPPLSYIISYDLETGKVDDLGVLKGKDGRLAFGMGAAAADKDGRIWFVGAFEESDERYKAWKIRGIDYSMGLGYYDPFED